MTEMQAHEALFNRCGPKSSISAMVIGPITRHAKEWAIKQKKELEREYNLRKARQRGTVKGNRLVYKFEGQRISERIE